MLTTLRAYSPRAPELERLSPSKNIAHDVARTLRRGIITLRIPPGAMLSEQDVGRKLGVSRQPVREAFIKLAEAKLLVIRPQRGTQVVRISRGAVDDALFIRTTVECAVAREAALRLDPRSETELEDNLERQKVLLGEPAFDPFFALDEEFHQLIAHAAGRAAAWSVIDNVKPHLDRVRWLGMDLMRPLSRIVGQHEAILRALKARDPDGAVEAMRVHVTDFIGLLDPIAAHYPAMFEEAAHDLDMPGVPIIIRR